MINYKEKALHHCKRKMNNFKLETAVPDYGPIELIVNSTVFDTDKTYNTWKEAYDDLKSFTKSTKREWVEDKIDCRLVLWDTDLEPEEQYCVDYMLEFFNYEQGSFELEELREILAENTDEENLVMTCDTLINALIRHGKETIETE